MPRTLLTAATTLGLFGGLLGLGGVIHGWTGGLLGGTGLAVALLIFAALILLGGAIARVRPRIAAALLLFGALAVLVAWGVRWESLPAVLILAATGLAVAGGLFAVADIAREEAPLAVYRHPLVIRVTHWINAFCILILLMSGLQIFNAHPLLYWGQASDFANPMLAMYAVRGEDGRLSGRTMLFGATYDTDGLFGASELNGQKVRRGFPPWATLPSYQDLATGRLWHFFFAWIFVINGLIYLVYALVSRHFRRDLLPTRDQWRHFGRTVWDHLRLRFPHGRQYNILQKLTYIGILVVLIVLVLAGLAMSPGLNAAFPWLPDAFGGRQSARTVHFVCATLVLLFVIVHVVLVIASGLWNNLIGMVTGRYAIREEVDEQQARRPA